MPISKKGFPWLIRLSLIVVCCVIGLTSLSVKAPSAHANQVPCQGVNTYWTYISSYTETLSQFKNAQFFTGVLERLNANNHAGCGQYRAAAAIKAPNGWPSSVLNTTLSVSFLYYGRSGPVDAATTSVNGTGEFWAVTAIATDGVGVPFNEAWSTLSATATSTLYETVPFR